MIDCCRVALLWAATTQQVGRAMERDDLLLLAERVVRRIEFHRRSARLLGNKPEARVHNFLVNRREVSKLVADDWGESLRGARLARAWIH